MDVFVWVKMEFKGIKAANQRSGSVDATLVVFEKEAFAVDGPVSMVNSSMGKPLCTEISSVSLSKSRICRVFCDVSPQHKPQQLQVKPTFGG